MPTGRSRECPEFEATHIGFAAFFSDIEECFSRAGIQDDQVATKITWAKRYGRDHAEEWSQIPCLAGGCPTSGVAPAGVTWDIFKAEVRKCYPQLDEDQLHTLADLDQLVAKNAAIATMTRNDLGNYLRPFRVRANFLVRKGLLSEREKSRKFIAGFSQSIRTAIATRLSITKPDVLPINGYQMTDIEAAAEFVISGGHDFAEFSPTNTPILPNASNRSTPTADVRNTDLFRELANHMTSELTKAVTNLNTVRGTIPNAPQMTPRPAQQVNPNVPQFTRECMFCSSTAHFIRQCAEAEEYVRQGKAIQSSDTGGRGGVTWQAH